MDSRPDIVQGSDRVLNLTIRDRNGDNVDINAETELTARFKKPDGTWLEVTLTEGKITKTDANLGKIQVSLDSEDTPEIEEGIKVSFHVLLDVGAHPGGTRRIARFNQAVDVISLD